MSDYGQSTGGIGGTLARVARGAVHPNLLLNVVGPLGVYQVFTGRGVSAVDALLVAAVFPVAAILVGVLRNRRLEPLGALSLLAIGLGVLGALVFDDPRFLLVKDSAVTGLFGLAFLGSLLIDRPLIAVLARSFAGGQAMPAQEQARLQTPAAHARLRRMTLVWGLALLGEAATRVVLSFLLAPALVLAISPLLALATFGPLALWSWRVRAAAQARAVPAA